MRRGEKRGRVEVGGSILCGMKIERIMMGWDKAALQEAARILCERYMKDGEWDMRRVVVAVPVGRASRRLLEIMVRMAEDVGGCLFPPRFVTVGQLPELLYEPRLPLASELEKQLLRAEILQRLGKDVVKTVVSHLPAENDVSGWWKLGEQFGQLADDLAGGRLCAKDVVDVCEEKGIDLGGEHMEERWAAVGAVDEAYITALTEMGKADKQRERLIAIEEGRCGFNGDLVLVGVADQNAMLNAMIRQAGGLDVEGVKEVAAEGDGALIVLSHCEEGKRDGLDEVGGLRVEYWAGQKVDLKDEMLRFVEKEGDLPCEVVRCIAEAGKERGGFKAEDVTVGLADETQAGMIVRAMEMAGLPARYAGGRMAMWSGPIVLLGMLGKYAQGKLYEDFAAIVRHVDVERYVGKRYIEVMKNLEGDETNGGLEGNPVRLSRYISRVDRYAAAHLQEDVQQVIEGVAGRDDSERMVQFLKNEIDGLLPADYVGKRSLHEWSEPIAEMLRKVYGDRELARFSEKDEPLYQSLKAVAGVLREQGELSEVWGGMPKVSLSEAVSITLGRLANQNVSPVGGEAAIELMGALDLQMDDAPVLVFAGFNEGNIPASRNADAFLPDGLRAGLGLTDNARRYARDVFLVNALIRSRAKLVVLAAKKSFDHSPMSPSRLMLACDDRKMVERVIDFFGEEKKGKRSAVKLMRAGAVNHEFLIPQPVVKDGEITQLSVTAFRDYLACPYRFYLKHVKKLKEEGDDIQELDGASFGTLAHKVMEYFGRSDVSESESVGEIQDYFSCVLDEVVRAQFGKRMKPAVRVQVEQLRGRLDAFAYRQAELAKKGWRILKDRVENTFVADVMVDGKAFGIKGKIDRIDVHPEEGVLLLDYKTGDTAKEPGKAHQRGGEWIDLQLPLYLVLAKAAGVVKEGQAVRMGYIHLPKQLDKAGVSLANWDVDDLTSAWEVRDDVIRAVRKHVFWPPGDLPRFDDGFSGVCSDYVFDREMIVARSEEGGKQ